MLGLKIVVPIIDGSDRLPSDALELAKVSRLLHCINNGTISKFKGLDFDEIEFDKGMLFHFFIITEYEYYISVNLKKWYTCKAELFVWYKVLKAKNKGM